MKLDELMVQDGSQDYYTAGFRATLEAHLAYLRTSSKTTTMALTPHEGVVYKADLFGLLTTKGVAPCKHWVVMRMNYLYSPRDYDRNILSLLIPAESELESFRQSWVASQKINA